MMTREEHIKRHKELHQYLDELVGDWMTHTNSLPSEVSIIDLMLWSSLQTTNPTEGDK